MQAKKTSILLFVALFLQEYSLAANQDLRIAPRFVPPVQNFDRAVLKVKRTSCKEALTDVSPDISLDQRQTGSISPEGLKEDLNQWTKVSAYTQENINWLMKIELSLPQDQITYLRFQHKDTPSAFSSIRIFAGETSEGSSIPLVMQLKFPQLKLDRTERNYELGLLTKSEEMGEVVAPMLKEALAFINHEVGTAITHTTIWAIARPAQARLYRQFGFQESGEKTSEGLIVLKASLAILEWKRVVGEALSNEEPFPLLKAEEYRKLKNESMTYSRAIRTWYQTFWKNEEYLSSAADKERLQWEIQATMRPAQHRTESRVLQFLLVDEAERNFSTSEEEKSKDEDRQARAVAAQLVIQDRMSVGLTTSVALRKIAFYRLDYQNQYRYNRHYAMGYARMNFGVPVYPLPAVISVPVYYSDRVSDMTLNHFNETMKEAERKDPSLLEPW